MCPVVFSDFVVTSGLIEAVVILIIGVTIGLVWLTWSYLVELGPACVRLWKVLHPPAIMQGGPNITALATVVAAVHRCLPRDLVITAWQDRILSDLRTMVREDAIPHDVADAIYVRVLSSPHGDNYYAGLVAAFGDSFTEDQIARMRAIPAKPSRQLAIDHGHAVADMDVSLARFYARVAIHEARTNAALYESVRGTVLRTPPSPPKRDRAQYA